MKTMTNLLLGAVAAMALAPAMASAQTGNPGGAINDNLGLMDYGVCRGTDPKCFHDWPRAARSGPLKVLLYTRTAGPRHANLGAALGPGLNPPLADDNVGAAPPGRRRPCPQRIIGRSSGSRRSSRRRWPVWRRSSAS